MTLLIADQLRRRARNRGADPLVTYYDLGSGERTELSATSFLNWVDKTSNLLVDELLLEPGAVIDLELARTAPGHWVSLVIELAAWQVGAIVRTGRGSLPTGGGLVDLLVLGPDWATHDRSGADAVLACSLHPLGLGFSAPLPSDVADFSLEVRGQSDFHAATPRTGSEIAWEDGERRLTQADLVGAADLLDGGAAATGRRGLVTPSDPWTTVRDGLIAPLLTDGSTVFVVGADPDGVAFTERVARIAETELVDPATVTDVTR